ncbi:hypothetical protein CFPU101_44270 [Chroococcus sp. FPU101]|nr:hypothetical protein CFPU101_44270 [Chroococcus sp. FPU101]
MSKKKKVLVSIIISSLTMFFPPSLGVKAEEIYQGKEQLAREMYWKGEFSEAIKVWKTLIDLNLLSKQQ